MCLQAECPDNATDTKGVVMHSGAVSVLGLVNIIVIPVALKDIQYNSVVIFVMG